MSIIEGERIESAYQLSKWQISCGPIPFFPDGGLTYKSDISLIFLMKAAGACSFEVLTEQSTCWKSCTQGFFVLLFSLIEIQMPETILFWFLLKSLT